MSFDCCQPSCDVPPVSIPGIQGASPCTNVTTAFTIPATTVTVSVIDTSEQIQGSTVCIDGPAHFTVTQILNANQMVLTFQNQTGDAAIGATINVGAKVCPSGQQGVAGIGATTTTQASISGLTVGQAVNINVASAAMFSVGQSINIGTAPGVFPAGSATLTINVIYLGSSSSLIACTTTYLNSGITSFGSNSLISASGQNGQNGYTSLTAPNPPATWNVPNAVGGTATYSVGSTGWMAVGQTVVISGPATFAVSAINSATSVTLTWLGATGDLAAGTLLSNTATVSPSGAPAIIAYYQNAFNTGGSPYTLTTSLGSVGLSINVPAGTYLIKCRLRFTFSSAYQEYSHSAPVSNPISVYQYNSSGQIANTGALFIPPSTGASAVPFQYDAGIFYYENVSVQPLTTLTIQAKIQFAPDAGSIQILEGSLIAIPV